RVLWLHPAPPQRATLPPHAALPISSPRAASAFAMATPSRPVAPTTSTRRPLSRAGGCADALIDPQNSRPWEVRHKESPPRRAPRSEEHTSELQSRVDLVCRRLLEKK